MRNSILFCLGLLSFASCKKEAGIPEPEVANPDAVVNVLKDNSGFDTVFNVVKGLSSATGLGASIQVADFSLENNNNFNIVYYTESPSQQSVLADYYRFSKNLTTQAVISLPQYADNLKTLSPAAIANNGFSLGLQQFKPYSNYFTYEVSRYSTTFRNSIEFRGDIASSIGNSNPIGVADLGYYYPAANIGGTQNADNAFGYFTLGTANASYLTKVCNPHSIAFLNKSGNRIIRSLLEPRQLAQGSSMAFTIRPDSVVASEYNYNTQTLSTVTRIKLEGVTSTTLLSTMRHYSADGKILSILLRDESLKKHWTFSYNFTTKLLTKGLENSTLEYSGDGTDMDLDELGNIYYSGFAANGANKTGVSIYKKGVDGQTTRIGADDFLKFGTIVKLKYLIGKVYFALNGKKTGLNKYQLSVLRQQ